MRSVNRWPLQPSHLPVALTGDPIYWPESGSGGMIRNSRHGYHEIFFSPKRG